MGPSTGQTGTRPSWCAVGSSTSPDVRSFHFEPVGDHAFTFDPGQFITLQLEIDGERPARCYTISSPPTRPHLISITVKRVVGGPVSNWLHDNVTTGSRIVAQAPLGRSR